MRVPEESLILTARFCN